MLIVASDLSSDVDTVYLQCACNFPDLFSGLQSRKTWQLSGVQSHGESVSDISNLTDEMTLSMGQLWAIHRFKMIYVP